MARRITIPITNHNADGVCTSNYLVEYRITGEAGYSFSRTMFESPIVLDNLQDNTSYDFRITRYCCSDVSSTPHTFSFSTSLLPAPTGFNATGGSESIALVWVDVAEADGYQLYRSATADFTISTLIYEGADNSFDDESLASATTYYYRLRAIKTAHAPSAYVTDNATTL